MTDQSTLAVPEARKHAFVHESTHMAASEPLPKYQSLPFAPERWQHGLAFGIGGIAAIAIGVFLLTQTASTPGLKSQLVLIGSVLVVCGFACQASALRDLFGRLVIDDQGVSIRTTNTGHVITWGELEQWEVQEQGLQHLAAPCVRFWIRGSACPVFVPFALLSVGDRHLVQQTMRCRAPLQEVVAKCATH